MKWSLVLILLTVKIGRSGKRWTNFVTGMKKFNSLASIDSKEVIIEGSSNEPKDESKKIIITHSDITHSTNILINKPNVNVSDEKQSIILNLMANLSNLDDCTGICDSHYGGSYIFPVLRSVNYDNNTVPTAFSDLPVDVSFSLKIIHLANFNSRNMDYSIDFEMQMSWVDPRLMNNYTRWIRIWEKRILDQIWKPDPYFVNSKHSHFHYVSFPNFRMLISPNGLVIYTMRITLQPSCYMVFCRFPHDDQQCQLIISSLSHIPSSVRFSWLSTNPINLMSTQSSPDFDLVSVDTHYCVVEGKLLPSSCLRALFKLKRTGTRFIVEKYIPSSLAMFFAWIAPFVPYNYEEVRIITPISVNKSKQETRHRISKKKKIVEVFCKKILIVKFINYLNICIFFNVLLTLVQMESGEEHVHISYLTSLDIWFRAMKIFTVLSLFESVVVLALIRATRAIEKRRLEAVNEFERENFRAKKRKVVRLYRRLDHFTQFFSPLLFITFLMYYIMNVVQGEDSECNANKFDN
ncbi:Neurotransmitter-gated ion-channel ligand binding domain family protein [Acanthocheilonema viteae]